LGKVSDIPDTNPYGYQDHLYDKSQPENLGFLQRFRSLLDSYEDRTSVGEVGDGDHSLQTVAAYTGGGDKLHMSYTFDLLSPEFSAQHVRGCVEAFETSVTDGWICWAFSNHDVVRHVTRWSQKSGADPEVIARFSVALLCSLRGSICFYQGEELGLEEADIAFEDLRDPYGIRFWPAFKGRDGCRTPMVWEANGENGGFSAGKPWLPVPTVHLRHSVNAQDGNPGSVLALYRAMLAFRKNNPVLRDGSIRFLDAPEGALAFLREQPDSRMLCLFNFSAASIVFTVPADLTVAKTTGPGVLGTLLEAGTISVPAFGYAFASAR
ncbi:MAG: alpha-amylase family glycosyl hydrolase, partial [Rhizobiaceae bacterium]